MSEHYQVLVPGEEGNEFPLFSVGCICGDIECDDYIVRYEPTIEEQRAIVDWARSKVLAEVIEALRKQPLAASMYHNPDDILVTVGDSVRVVRSLERGTNEVPS